MSDETTNTVTEQLAEPAYVPDGPLITHVVIGPPKGAPETFDLPTDDRDENTPDLVSEDGDTQLEVKEPVPTEKVKRMVRTKPKTTTATKTVTARKPRRKDGAFPVPQLRAFKSLLALGATEPGLGVTLAALAKNAKISTNGMRRGIGPTDKKTVAAHEARYGYKCLITRGMVKFTHDEEQGTCYYLTALGTKKAEQERDAGNLKLGKARPGGR